MMALCKTTLFSKDLPTFFTWMNTFFEDVSAA